MSPIIKKIAQNKDINNVIKYLKDINNKESYEKYIEPIIKEKGRKYADKLLGSTIIVLKERKINLDDISFDENDNIITNQK